MVLDVSTAEELIQEHRWLDAESTLVENLQGQPEAVDARAALARVKLALGNPNAALELLSPCRDHIQCAGLYWCARVRVATTNHQAAATVQEALQTSAMPAHVIEEWRMITSGLITAGWHDEARAWLLALGPWANGLSLEPYWNGTQKARDLRDGGLDALTARAVLHPAPFFQTKAKQLNRQITQTWLQGLPPRPNPWPGPRRRWLLCGDRGLPQCWLYRVQQKQEQLQALGGEAQLLERQELQQLHNSTSLAARLQGVEGLLIQRLKAEASVIELIAEARRQGIPVVVDLDDLLFDPEHAPPPLANYAGSITPEQHRRFQATQPQLEATLAAADLLLFSTAEIAERWQRYRRARDIPSVPVQLWPNLIPAPLQAAWRQPQIRQLRQRSGRLRLVVASASTPHLLAWHQQLVPALVELMQQHPRLQLDLLGSVPLAAPLEPFRQRIRCRGHSDFSTYLQRLAEADIGLMVLEPGPFTDAKSPNRWMECSLMGLATVLSPIRSCTDLLEHGVHTRFASQPQDWVEQINQLLRHPRQRLQLVQQAQQLAWQQLRQEHAAALWAPLLQAQTTAPRRVLLVSEQISGAPLDPPDRLGRDLLRNLLQPPHQAVDWMVLGQPDQQSITAIGPTRHCWIAPAPDLNEPVKDWLMTHPPALIHLLRAGPLASTVATVARSLQIPTLLHLNGNAALAANSLLQTVTGCLSASPELLQYAEAAGARVHPPLVLPWQPRSRHQQQPRDQPHVLCLADGHWSSGLLTLQEALQRNEAPAVRLTVLLGSPKTPRPQPQHWGGSVVDWCAPATDQELEALLAHQDLLVIADQVHADDLRLARELVSAGLWLIASSSSNAAQLLQLAPCGTAVPAQDPDALIQALQHWRQHRPSPEPLLSFPSLETDLAQQLAPIHSGLRLESPKQTG